MAGSFQTTGVPNLGCRHTSSEESLIATFNTATWEIETRHIKWPGNRFTRHNFIIHKLNTTDLHMNNFYTQSPTEI
jgi:hypothetical protein